MQIAEGKQDFYCEVTNLKMYMQKPATTSRKKDKQSQTKQVHATGKPEENNKVMSMSLEKSQTNK